MNKMESEVVIVKDMTSLKDADTVLNALLGVWGIDRAEINLEKHQALFTYDERMASSQDFEQAILDSGFEIETSQPEKLNLTERRKSN